MMEAEDAMPTIRVRGHDASFTTNLTTSILNTLLRNGFPIETICGGRAVCGRDIIRVWEGALYVSPRREAEVKRLEALAAQGEPSGPDVRLACQCYVRGDIEIEVFHIARRGP
jgi:ferredoxin